MAEYLVIGPTKAGKTGLLAALYRATQDIGDELRSEGMTVKMPTMNTPMQKLCSQGEGIVDDGRLQVQASNDLVKYEFTLEITWPRFPIPLWPRKKVQLAFTTWDGPGGSLFDTHNAQTQVFDDPNTKKFRDEQIQALRRADGFILCLDATDDSLQRVLFRTLPRIMREADMADLPCTRVVICLTKVDKLYKDRGTEAYEAAMAASAIELSRALLPKTANATLHSYCTNARFGFGSTSVFGFLPDGRPNYDPVGDRLQFWGDMKTPEGVPAVDAWQPFRVLDPFLWLAGAPCRDLEILSRNTLRS